MLRRLFTQPSFTEPREKREKEEQWLGLLPDDDAASSLFSSDLSS
jgi:hypothetical protein